MVLMSNLGIAFAQLMLTRTQLLSQSLHFLVLIFNFISFLLNFS